MPGTYVIVLAPILTPCGEGGVGAMEMRVRRWNLLLFPACTPELVGEMIKQDLDVFLSKDQVSKCSVLVPAVVPCTLS